ncbi:MAG: alkaline phosphatase D family protein [Planctomycetota bacterium]
MKRRDFLWTASAIAGCSRCALADSIEPQFRVSLPEAHRGTLEIDTKLLDSYGPPPSERRQFYLAAREVFERQRDTGFDDPAILDAARQHSIDLMGGPMLGDLRHDGVTIWMRPATDRPLFIRLGERLIPVGETNPGTEVRIPLSGLNPMTQYGYQIETDDRSIATGSFRTAPKPDHSGSMRIAFGSCFHKIGVHNPNLFREIIAREPTAMMLLGDLAVDDRRDDTSMHRSDYQLRDVSQPWQHFVSQIPTYSAWDDHDYLDNDLSGIPRRFTAKDRSALRNVWHQNWNNPSADDDREGIYHSTRVGPAEIIMLDTRSCRDNQRRSQRGSYLGDAQMRWLKQVLSKSTAPFKIISSGTMWSDYVSKAKDSWGTWDTEAREELFDFIESNKIAGVLLVSGDRHGARAFRIPRSSGFQFYEFEPATLGGASGPEAWVDDCPEQIFGYGRDNLIAFGEFTFDTSSEEPSVTFRLIKETGEVLEEHMLTYQQLTP